VSGVSCRQAIPEEAMAAQDEKKREQINPGDHARPGTHGTGENLCPVCGGTGRVDAVACTNCGGTGKVIEGIGGA
jgi:hypothetical protein